MGGLDVQQTCLASINMMISYNILPFIAALITPSEVIESEWWTKMEFIWLITVWKIDSLWDQGLGSWQHLFCLSIDLEHCF